MQFSFWSSLPCFLAWLTKSLLDPLVYPSLHLWFHLPRDLDHDPLPLHLHKSVSPNYYFASLTAQIHTNITLCSSTRNSLALFKQILNNEQPAAYSYLKHREPTPNGVDQGPLVTAYLIIVVGSSLCMISESTFCKLLCHNLVLFASLIKNLILSIQ